MIVVRYWFLLCSVLALGAQGQHRLPSADMNTIITIVLNAIQKGEELQQYERSFTSDPLNGPFFYPLWDLSHIYNSYATLGLPSPESNLSVSINPRIRAGESTEFNVNNKAERYNITESFTTFQLMNKILLMNAEDISTVVVTKTDCSNYKLLKTPQLRIAYNEAVRPRYYLALFINVYRVLIRAYDECRMTGEDKCARFFNDYQHLLWMYSWIICQYIGSSPSLDVDGICPKVCRPHKRKITENREYPTLFYSTNFNKDALDLCEQLQYALPGSCSLIGNGVGMFDFKCECASNAYEWKTTRQLRGCLLKDSIMATEKSSNETNWRVPCTSNETEQYCNTENTELCYYRLWKESKEPVLKLTTFVRQSRTPFCHCKKGFAGTTCSDKFDPCIHNIPFAINDPENYMNIHIPEGPFMPLYSIEELSGASGNWLCGVKSERGVCKPTNNPDFPFKCICSKSYGRDELYSVQDNCMKEAGLDRATEIDGQPAVYCGKGICTRGGKCVYKVLGENMVYNISDVSAERETADNFDIAEVCQCPSGYVGSDCDVEENIWSAWEAWSPCVPNCGRMRYRYRVRMCVGDMGCIGSALESLPCPITDCPLLSVINASGKSTEYSEEAGHYYQVTHASLLSWMLGLVIPLEIFLILAGLFILEKCFVKSRS